MLRIKYFRYHPKEVFQLDSGLTISQSMFQKHKVLKVYYQQIKKLDQQPSDKADVITSERKLQTMGFVDYVENLTTYQQQMLANTKVINFIPHGEQFENQIH